MQHQHNQQKCKVLITGGSGYIGQVTTQLLMTLGFDVWILDVRNPKRCIEGQFIQTSILAPNLEDVFESHTFDCVIHLAALISVAESVINEEEYFENNVLGTQNLLRAMTGRCNHIVFTSSAAVYGTLDGVADEDAPKNPTSPYGMGKLQSEMDIRQSTLSSCILRLFNVAGAVPMDESSEMLGEEHLPETHLIPLVIQRHLQQRSVQIYGSTYDTFDGTCVREYVHVQDVADAILKSLTFLLKSPMHPISTTLNVSSASPSSVLQVINTLNDTRPSGLPMIVPETSTSRPGDPARILSSIGRIQRTLNWYPEHSSLKEITKSAWTHQLQLFQPS